LSILSVVGKRVASVTRTYGVARSRR